MSASGGEPLDHHEQHVRADGEHGVTRQAGERERAAGGGQYRPRRRVMDDPRGLRDRPHRIDGVGDHRRQPADKIPRGLRRSLPVVGVHAQYPDVATVGGEQAYRQAASESGGFQILNPSGHLLRRYGQVLQPHRRPFAVEAEHLDLFDVGRAFDVPQGRLVVALADQ